MTPWADLQPHRAWLEAHTGALLDFAAASRHPHGGFAWLDAAGFPRLEQPVEAWITCRMTHVFALGHLLGRPGFGPLADHGVAALTGLLRDGEHGGWYAAVGPHGPTVADKRAYEHAFVVLAASSAAVAGRPGAAALLDEALAVVEARFWDESEGLCRDVWDRTWTSPEAYRGVNANMHTVEAFLAAADATGDGLWRDRALRIAERVLHRWARENGWRIPEHFDAEWRPLPDYNRDHPAHPFRPYGATVGHGLEWSRLALHLHAALGAAASGWLPEAARALFDRAVADGWAVDGADGFVYTTDWDGTPVVRDRMHWVACEAVAAAAALREVTGDDGYDSWYRTWWDYSARHLLDPAGGSWHHQLDPANRPVGTVWDGKPDVYHAVQAALLPRLPLAPTLATALRAGLLR